MTLASYDWTLKHLKLVALHSVNHSLQSERDRHAVLINFEQRWDEWIDKFIAGAHHATVKQRKELDFYTSTSNWQFSE